MSTLIGPGSSPAPAPYSSGPASRPLVALAQVTESVRRANHVTGFASWMVATIAMGLMFELAGMRSPGPPGLVALLALLIPMLAAGVRAVGLLCEAASVQAVVGGEPRWSAGASADEPPTAEAAWTRLHLATAAVQYREILARRALTWCFVCAAGFVAWSVAATLIQHR